MYKEFLLTLRNKIHKETQINNKWINNHHFEDKNIVKNKIVKTIKYKIKIHYKF